MARLNGVPDAVYAALARIRSVALGGDEQSLFEPSQKIWTTIELEKLHGLFVAKFDNGQSLVKARPLVEAGGDASIQLFAELLYAQQFFAASTSSDKLRNIQQVLSWAKTKISVPGWAHDGEGFGLGDDQSFNTERLFHVAWLLELAIAWRRLGADTKQLEDPWRLEVGQKALPVASGSPAA